MEQLNKYLVGKKTYIVTAITIVLVLLNKFAGIEVPGFPVGEDWLQIIIAALGLGTLRAGVTKSGPTA
jgi:hypothetical protein